jgi:uncharacterized LabA/DUF88 family protein
MTRANGTPGLRVGLYVDVANLTLNGGRGMRYDVLREFACRGSADSIRLNAYVAFDADRAATDPAYRASQEGFHSALRDFGFKVIRKTVKWYTDESGRHPKANVDLDMAVDALLQSENIDRVLLATGDGDFVQVVRALQNRGCRVEILAFDNVSRELREEADLFMSGYLVPGLLPIPRGRDCPAWGAVGSFARGVCHSHDLERRYGFIRYLYGFDTGDLWKTDARLPGSPYKTIFFHDSELPDGVRPADLPSREIVLEFQIAEGEPGKGHKAVAVEWVNRRWRSAPAPVEDRGPEVLAPRSPAAPLPPSPSPAP